MPPPPWDRAWTAPIPNRICGYSTAQPLRRQMTGMIAPRKPATIAPDRLCAPNMMAAATTARDSSGLNDLMSTDPSSWPA